MSPLPSLKQVPTQPFNICCRYLKDVGVLAALGSENRKSQRHLGLSHSQHSTFNAVGWEFTERYTVLGGLQRDAKNDQPICGNLLPRPVEYEEKIGLGS